MKRFSPLKYILMAALPLTVLSFIALPHGAGAQGMRQDAAQMEVTQGPAQPAQDVTGQVTTPDDVVLEPAIVMPEGHGQAGQIAPALPVVPAAEAGNQPEGAQAEEAAADPAAQPAAPAEGTDIGTPAIRTGADMDKLTAEQEALKQIADQDRGMVTLFFTEWQHTAIREARRSRGLVRPLSEEERDEIMNRGVQQQEDVLALPPPPPEERNITLGGIVYAADGSWTIWLNGKRVTPKSLPPQVLDLKVYKNHIDMKWVDGYTNQIYPIRMRPHQRFNLDTRIFLPG